MQVILVLVLNLNIVPFVWLLQSHLSLAPLLTIMIHLNWLSDKWVHSSLLLPWSSFLKKLHTLMFLFLQRYILLFQVIAYKLLIATLAIFYRLLVKYISGFHVCKYSSSLGLHWPWREFLHFIMLPILWHVLLFAFLLSKFLAHYRHLLVMMLVIHKHLLLWVEVSESLYSLETNAWVVKGTKILKVITHLLYFIS